METCSINWIPSLLLLVSLPFCSGKRDASSRFCKDQLQYRDCKIYKDLGYCETHQQSLHTLCPVACDLCEWGTKNAKKCADEDGYFNCQFLKSNGVCRTHADLMSGRCSRTCNLCDAGEKCSKMTCSSRKVCIVDKAGQPQCECPKYCPYKTMYEMMGKVCGTDGKTYKDYCHLLDHACRKGTDVVVAYYGECGEGGSCQDAKLEQGLGMCESWKNMGLCNAHKELLSKYCEKTCEFCSDRFPYPGASCHTTPFGCCWNELPATGPNGAGCTKCEDLYPDLCPIFMQDCSSAVGKNIDFMKKSCPATCGFCMPSERPRLEIQIYTDSGSRHFRTQLRQKADIER